MAVISPPLEEGLINAPLIPRATAEWTRATRQVCLLLAWHFSSDTGKRRIAEVFGRPAAGLRAALIRHRVLHWAALAAADPTAPSDLAELPLAAARRRQELQVLLQTAVIHTVASCLRDAGARPLLVKGQALATLTSGNPASRGLGDVDVLIDPTSMERSLTALAGLGASVSAAGGPIAHTRNAQWAGTTIELHHRLDPLTRVMRISHGELWERRQEVTIGGAPVDTLGVADSILMTASHHGRDGWPIMRSVQDMALLVARYPGAVDEAIIRSAEAGVRRRLAVALEMVRPLTPHDHARDRAAVRQAAINWGRLAVDRNVLQSDEPRDLIERTIGVWNGMDTVQDRAEMLRAYVTDKPQSWGAAGRPGSAIAAPYFIAKRLRDRARLTRGR